MIAGSHAYNLQINNSDFDILGVYESDIIDYLGLPEKRYDNK
jgi:predicted nucleotidyltransferase